MKEEINWKKMFENPTIKYRGKPFWAWNGKLEKKELLRQIDVFKKMGFGGFFMHSRTGLETEYLGEEWFQKVDDCVEFTQKCNMEPWLYDEDRWPSGSAGGLVTRKQEYRASFLQVDQIGSQIKLEKILREKSDIVACFACHMDQMEVSKKRKMNAGELLEEGETALVFSIVQAPCKEVYNGNTYLDTMNKNATQYFIQTTHEKYKQFLNAQVFESICGIFTDEPHRGPMFTKFSGGEEYWVPYTPDLFQRFLDKYEYDLRENLPELFYRKKGELLSKTTYQYIEICEELFLENFVKPIQQWCHENHMMLTGHVLHEDSLCAQTIMQGSLMRFYEYMDIPGIDHLLRDNYCFWIVKQVVSVAKQLGKKQVLSELYGGTGWKTTLEEYKQIGDWQALFGINLRCPHLAWYTMKGEAKRDYPASISYHLSGWEEYHNLEDYFSRIHAFLDNGQEKEELLVICPIESVWARSYSGAYDNLQSRDSIINEIEEKYERLFQILTKNQIGFDYGEEALMEKYGSVEDGFLKIGQCAYKRVIICGMHTIRSSTLKLIREFQYVGGEVIFIGNVPKYVDVEFSHEVDNLADKAIKIPFEESQIVKVCEKGCWVDVEGEGAEDILVCRRCGRSGTNYMFLNQNRKTSHNQIFFKFTDKKIFNNMYVLEEWNARTGKIVKNSFEKTEDSYISKQLDFAPGEEKLLRIYELDRKETVENIQHKIEKNQVFQLPEKYEYRLSEKNICVLDQVYVQFWSENGKEHFIESQEVLRADQTFRIKTGKKLRSGEMLQPWYQSKYCNENKQSSKVILNYSFIVEKIPESMELVLENIEHIHQIWVNGVSLEKENLGVWIDSCLNRIELPVYMLKQGCNEIKVEQEISGQDGFEAAYLLGDFSVYLENGKTPIIRERPNLISLGDVTKQGFPFYSGKITYCLPRMYNEKVSVTLKEWKGWTATITDIHGKNHFIGFAPYTIYCDGIKEFSLFLTRKNTFGPLHEKNPDPPVCEPNSFLTVDNEWTNCYTLQEQGIMSIQIEKCKTEEERRNLNEENKR